jgi:exopolysaccharide biosynthesis polyprenyl glycosylphosphotransferase
MIPRRFFLCFDVCAMLVAFFAADLLVMTFSGVVFSSEVFRDIALFLNPSSEFQGPGQLPRFGDLLWIFLATAPVSIIVLSVLGNYGPVINQSGTRILAGGLLAPLAGLGSISLALFALKNPNWSRLFIFSFTALSSFLLMFYRICLRLYFLKRRSTGYYAKNVLVVGSCGAIERLVDHFKKQIASADYQLVGYLRIAPNDPPPDCDLRFMGQIDQLGELLVNRPIHDVVIVQPVAGGDWMAKAIEDCDYFGVVVRIVPEPLITEPERFRVSYARTDLRLPELVLAPPNWNSEALFLKRVIDVVLSSLALAILFPLFVIIMAAIKLTTPGLPVFYKWRVVGRNGREFTGYKFTTMILSADQLKEQLADRNEMQGPVFKIKNDPRTTPLGRFLRKYSLNELPQLWSVLKGDMSLVGPRPAFRHELERYEFWHKRKLSINPGITCLWQVRGRNKINQFDDWVRMDLEYIDNWSLWLDVKILARTAWVVISGTGS